MNWPLVLVGLPLAGVVAWQAWLQHQLILKWTRILCEKQGIPSITMEPERPAAPTVPAPDTRKRVVVRIPGIPWRK